MRTASGTQVGPGRLLALVLFVGLGIAFWDSPLLWPLKLLVVMMHETGHAAAALLVGGSVERVLITSGEAGECLSRLPASFLGQVVVFSAGYLGSTLAGAMLLVATLRFQLRRPVLVLASVWLGAMGVLYAGDPFTLAFCLGMAALLALGARLLPDGAVDAVNLFLAAFSVLYALVDLRDDLWDSAVRAHSDAALLAQITWVPALVWAALWTLASLLLMGASLAWTLRRERSPTLPFAPLPSPPGRGAG
ncbi:MAG: M50 family metallopeptidase [Myxococcaceae bacterium]|nr:M50 family metallopeptidase [Myxococcaceae bacterium]MCI0671044.1 M50 family metallopeptidase [Myxococcaceae bacterium]